MRLSGLFGPTVVGSASIVLSLSTASQAVQFQPVASANLNLQKLGRVALTGDFDSISLYSYQGQNENSFSTNGSQSLLQQMPNGAFNTLVQSDAMIITMCQYIRRNGDFQGIIVGGNFTSLSGTPAQGVALWNPSSNSITPLPGLNGSVNSVFCNPDSDSVFVGGDFHGGNSTNAIVWQGMSGWSNMPFQGFNGPVNAINKAPDGNIIFGGAFTGLSDTTTPTKKDQQVINLSSANISGSDSATAGFSNPKQIVCNTEGTEGAGHTWLTPDNGGGFWQADFNLGFVPTKLRLWNTHFQGRGTKQWRFTAFPLNGIMNFTYTDPDTGLNGTCDNDCSLSSTASVKFQDFHFVNPVGMNSFKIDLKEWYGKSAGLNGLQMFQDDIFAYAVSDLNEPACSGSKFASNSTATGPWSVAPSGQSGSQFLTAKLTKNVTPKSAEVKFLPDIQQAANYTVTIYTPGCQQDSSCGSRGTANVSGIYSAAGKEHSVLVTQTNDFDKYDEIFSGPVDANSASFRPTVTLAPGQNTSLELVALRVRFSMQGNASGSGAGLNGLFEYDPDVVTIDTDFSKNKFDAAGTDLEDTATITSLEIIGQTTYIGGNFSNSKYSNIFSITNNGTSSLTGGGVNNAVAAILPWGNLLFVAGNFTDTITQSTAGIKHVAVYDTAAKTWAPLGGGVNGPVSNIVPLLLNITENKPETCVTVNGQFDSVLPSGSKPSFPVDGGLAIWVPSRNDWLQNLNIQAEAIHGQLTAATNITGGSPLLAGTISSQGWALSDAVALSASGDISPIGLQVPLKATTSSKIRKRDAISQNVTGAVTGLFVTDNGRNLSVLAGSFAATATNGSTITNLAIINSTGDGTQVVTGLNSGIDSDSIFRAVSRNGDTLAAGGEVTGNIAGNPVDGLLLWDLGTSDFTKPQPPALTGDEVAVYTISTRPSSQDLYVGGNFSGGGLIQCPSLCVYTGGQWSRPGISPDGTISTMMWQGDNQLLVGGTLSLSGNNSYLATYEVNNNQAWSIPAGAQKNVPGPVTAMTPGNNGNTEYWIAGADAKNSSAYLIYFDGTNFQPVPDLFNGGTIVHGLSIVSLAKSGTGNYLIGASFALLITGNINVPSFGNASAVLFNGTSLTPYILSNSNNGPGVLSQFVTEKVQSFASAGNHMKLGFVVLIALAIALGVIFLLVALGLLLERRRKKAEGYRPAPQNYFEKTANMGRIPPERLFSSLNPSNSAPRV